MNIKIRKIKSSDLDNIMNLFESTSIEERYYLALDLKDRLQIISLIKNEQGFVATIHDNIIGVALYIFPINNEYNDYALLDEFLIHKNYRKIGIGRALIEKFHSYFNKSMARTKSNNSAMISLLKSYGYKKFRISFDKSVITWKRN